MTPDQIAKALTSGMLGPALGAGFVLVSWLLKLYRAGVPLRAQVAHAGGQLRPMLIPSLSAGGGLLMLGMGYRFAATVAIAALLTASGLTAPAQTEVKS